MSAVQFIESSTETHIGVAAISRFSDGSPRVVQCVTERQSFSQMPESVVRKRAYQIVAEELAQPEGVPS